MIKSLGIDPDVHGCAFAQIIEEDSGKRSLKVCVVRQKDGKGRDAALALIRQDAFDIAVQGLTLDSHYPDVLTVEGQDVRYTGKTSFANPQDVCNLSLISGAAIAYSVADTIYCPFPREWKGTVRKDVKQRRILSELGIRFTEYGGDHPYPVPVDFEQYCVGKVNAGDWKDLTDAVGLASWGLEKYKEGMKRGRKRCVQCGENEAECMGGLCFKCDHLDGDREN